MSKTFTCTKVHQVTLPEQAIYDYIFDECVPHETVMEVKDDQNRVTHLEYNKKRNVRGLMLAWADDDKKLIRMGYSRCHEDDAHTFNMVDAINIAMERGMSKNEYILADEVKEFEEQFKKFRDRVKKYYKQLMFKEWRMFKYLEKQQYSPKMEFVEINGKPHVRMHISEEFKQDFPLTECNRNRRVYTAESIRDGLNKFISERYKKKPYHHVVKAEDVRLFMGSQSEIPKSTKNTEATISVIINPNTGEVSFDPESNKDWVYDTDMRYFAYNAMSALHSVIGSNKNRRKYSLDNISDMFKELKNKETTIVSKHHACPINLTLSGNSVVKLEGLDGCFETSLDGKNVVVKCPTSVTIKALDHKGK